MTPTIDEIRDALRKRGRPFVVGITGGIGAGKSRFAADLMQALGDDQVIHIELDALGHKALEQKQQEVVERFESKIRKFLGDDLVNWEGKIRRQALGAWVFGRPTELAALEAILHPTMARMARDIIVTAGPRLVIMSAAVLAKLGLDEDCNLVLVVRAPAWVRLKRTMKRDGLSLFGVLGRMRAQIKIVSQLKNSPADTLTIDFWGGKGAESEQLDRVLHEIWNRAGVSS